MNKMIYTCFDWTVLMKIKQTKSNLNYFNKNDNHINIFFFAKTKNYY